MVKNKEAKKALKTLYKFCMERNCYECILSEKRIAIDGTEHHFCALKCAMPIEYNIIVNMMDMIKVKEIKNNEN